MHCKSAWDREFIDKSCTKTFRNDGLKTHREQILFEREKCLLPEAQTVVANRREIEKHQADIGKIQERMMHYRNEILRHEYEIGNIRQRPMGLSDHKKFVRKCPVNECRGFLSTQWNCDVCENHICKECNEIKNDGHECDAGSVETMKLLKHDTKSCPECGTMIFKISGCAQMWCPNCHTAFDWNTGRIETGVIHNPHFFDFRRQNGGLARQPGDEPGQCGGLPSLREIEVAVKVDKHIRLLYQVVRLVNHIDRVEIINRENRMNTLEMRVDYLMNIINEDTFKKKLQQLEKKREKQRDIRNIYVMFSQTSSDVLRQIIAEPIKIQEFIEILINLRDYTNNTFTHIRYRYNCIAPRICDNWDIM